jgi:hypothetical protein
MITAGIYQRLFFPGEDLMNVMDKRHLIFPMIFIFLISGCGRHLNALKEKPQIDNHVIVPAPPPNGILISEVPQGADIILSSVRHVLSQSTCLEVDNQLKTRFIQDPECNQSIYNPSGGLAIPRQLFFMDIDTSEVTQITNTDCVFISGQYIDSYTLMTNAICVDSNQDGEINEQDDPDLYYIDLPAEELHCLTCDHQLRAINNPDYSPISGKIVFSAQVDPVFHNYLFIIDLEKNLQQITGDDEFMDFDCAWSEDATLIAFNRLPAPWFENPAQIWLMNSDGTNLRQITTGGDNPIGEGPHRRYPIGTDADADLSPDNTHIVFSRLKTGQENVPIGVWELIVIDINGGSETILDTSYANMVPEWKTRGIIFTRQVGDADPMQVKQGLYLYADGAFRPLEEYPYDVYPIGAYGGNWIVRNTKN